MKNLPFDLPHTIYIDILHNLRNLGGMDDIYYAMLMNKILWDQGVYLVFDKMIGLQPHHHCQRFCYRQATKFQQSQSQGNESGD